MLKQRFSQFFLRNTSEWKFWVLFALVCKGLFFIFLISRQWWDNHYPGFWGVDAGDTGSYTVPIQNLIANGNYSPDFRMPGYGAIYLPFALFFSNPVAYNCLIVCQFILASLTVYPLALIAKYVFKSTSLFYLTFYLFAFNIYSNLFDSTLLTESFAVSFLILSVFFLIKAFENESKRNINLLLSGLFLTEVIFLRPVFIPLLLLFSIVLVVYLFKNNLGKQSIAKVLLFLLPFLIIDGAWVTRNFIKYNRIIPATPALYYPSFGNSYYVPLYELVRSWGGSDQHWDPDAEIRWFGMNDGLQPELHNVKVSLPENIYTSIFNYDSLVVLKQQLAVYIANESDFVKVHSSEMKALLETIRNKCFLYAKSVRQERPFLFYLIAPLKRTKVFLIHSGTYNMFTTLTSKLDPISYGTKVFFSLLYLSMIGLGLLGIILLIKKSILFSPLTLITGIVFYTIFIHPIYFGMCEKRYFLPAYPFLLICAAYIVNSIWTSVSKRLFRTA